MLELGATPIMSGISEILTFACLKTWNPSITGTYNYWGSLTKRAILGIIYYAFHGGNLTPLI